MVRCSGVEVIIPLDGSRKDDLALQVLAVQVSLCGRLLPLFIRHDSERLDEGKEAAKREASKAPGVGVQALGEAVQVGEHDHLILGPEIYSFLQIADTDMRN